MSDLIILISKFHYYVYSLFTDQCTFFILVLYCFLFVCFPDRESQPADTDNEDNLLGNVSSCFNSLDIKQDFRVEILQEQENKQSRKRQNNTTDKEKEVIISGEYATGIYVPILFVKSILSL